MPWPADARIGDLDRARLVERVRALHPDARESDVRIVRAPGRLNLIGEHTDYNDGFVLPVAIGLETWIAYAPTEDGRVELTSVPSDGTGSFDLAAIGTRRGDWIDYVAGVAWAMTAAGLRTTGLRGAIAATLPREAGLSSSASLELAAAWCLSGQEKPDADPLDLARICQRAENGYVGVRSGLMDQFAVACGQPEKALLLDCRSLEHRAVALPAGLALVACDTGSRRRLGASGYNARREQCERALTSLAAQRQGLRTLRDLDLDDLSWAERHLTPLEFRRVRHVVSENARVLASVRALESGDLDALGAIFAASHASLRDDYEVSSPELDALVEIATRTRGVVATRMTGAGFGGCTVNLVQSDAVERLRAAILRDYRLRSGLEPTVHAVEAVVGAGPVTD